MSEKSKRVRTKDKGVYVLTSAVRRHNGKADQCFYITYKDGDRKVWEKVGWRSEKISQATAVSLLQERMHEKATGAPVNPRLRKTTFRQAYEEWERLHLPRLKECDNIKSRARKYVLPYFGDRALGGITTHDLEKYRAEMDCLGLSAQSVTHNLGLIRRVYNKAVEWGMYSGLIPTVTMPTIDAQRLRYLTRKEAAKLLAELKTLSGLWHDIVLLALNTGIRFGDITRLIGRQINFEAGYIDVVESKPGTYAAYFPEHVREMLRSRVGYEPDAFVFPSERTGGRIRTCGKAWKEAVAACGLNEGETDRRYKFVFHCLRHTFASWLSQEGVSESIISALMGATPRTTQRYAKLSPDSKKTAINKVLTSHLIPSSDNDYENSE